MDGRGLWLNDPAKGWAVRVGDIQRELMFMDGLNARVRRDFATGGSVFGVHFSKKF